MEKIRGKPREGSLPRRAVLAGDGKIRSPLYQQTNRQSWQIAGTSPIDRALRASTKNSNLIFPRAQPQGPYNQKVGVIPDAWKELVLLAGFELATY